MTASVDPRSDSWVEMKRTHTKGRGPMKITKKLLAVCVAALALSMALMGCNGGTSSSSGGSASKGTTEQKESKKPADNRIDFTWFKASVPEGYDVWSDSGDGGFVGSICFKNVDESDKSISFDVESDDAETLVADETESDGYEAGEDITIGKYTWKTVNFTWNKTPSVELISEIPDTGQSVVIYLFMTTPDDPAVKAFLESLEFPENLEEAHNEAKNLSIADLCKETGLTEYKPGK